MHWREPALTNTSKSDAPATRQSVSKTSSPIPPEAPVTDAKYTAKFESFKSRTLFRKLGREDQAFVDRIAFEHRLTFQEFRQVVEACRDLTMWDEESIDRLWRRAGSGTTLEGSQLKRHLMKRLQKELSAKRREAKHYPANGSKRPNTRVQRKVTTQESDRKIHGMCPVASEETVCCNLRTIDAVQNCAFGCSYCTIQTFYSHEFIFDKDFQKKLDAIPIEPDRYYHYGTGQSSDSLVWGNKNGILDALCNFARKRPNVLLELKTKSDNVGYFLDNEIPRNLVCSWSLNTQTIVDNEEHFTADLRRRLEAARRVADRGVAVAFHFHPMVYYHGWLEEYTDIGHRLLESFDPDEILFISFGSITMIKPVMKKIRELGMATKILQMELVPDPHGKMTYPDELKVEMFRGMHRALEPWHRKVFMYLCMEKAKIWHDTFGFAYPTNEEFERQFTESAFQKLESAKPPS